MTGLRIVERGGPEWPPSLNTLPAINRLWLRGPLSLTLAAARSVAIVGARAATPYGTHVAIELSASLAEMGITIVSGAAYGVDAAAHRGALAVGGRTIAVLAFGVDLTYPRGHASLLASIARDGLLLSAYPPGAAPQRIRFRERDTLIATLSAGAVVVEAGTRSGTIATALQAQEFGRPVMAVPGPVTSAQSAGTHLLIRDQHAHLVTTAADIIKHLALR